MKGITEFSIVGKILVFSVVGHIKSNTALSALKRHINLIGFHYSSGRLCHKGFSDALGIDSLNYHSPFRKILKYPRIDFTPHLSDNGIYCSWSFWQIFYRKIFIDGVERKSVTGSSSPMSVTNIFLLQ